MRSWASARLFEQSATVDGLRTSLVESITQVVPVPRLTKRNEGPELTNLVAENPRAGQQVKREDEKQNLNHQM